MKKEIATEPEVLEVIANSYMFVNNKLYYHYEDFCDDKFWLHDKEAATMLLNIIEGWLSIDTTWEQCNDLLPWLITNGHIPHGTLDKLEAIELAYQMNPYIPRLYSK